MSQQNSEQEVLRLIDAWADAELHGDNAFLHKALVDDFIAIGPRGYTLTKGQWLERFTSGDMTYQVFTLAETSVRLYGNAAIVTSKETMKGRYRDYGQEGQFRITLLCVQQGKNWLIAGHQLSPIAPVAEGV